jgi:tetratricopeptide (TPR) repeat protein
MPERLWTVLRKQRSVQLVLVVACLVLPFRIGWDWLRRPAESRLLKEAIRLADRGDRVASAELLDQLLRRNPAQGRALLLRGQLAHEAGDTAGAQRYWGQIPDHAAGIASQARFLEGLLFMETGRARGAEAALLKSVALNSAVVEPHEALLKLYAHQLRTREIRRELRAIRSFRPWKLTELYQLVNAAGEAVNRADAIPRLEKFAATDPDDLHSLTALGRYYLWDERPGDAAAALRPALVRHAQASGVRALIAEAELSRNNAEGAREVLGGVRPAHGSPQSVWRSYGLCLAASGEWSEAAACFRRAVTLNPWDRPTLLQLVAALEHIGEGAQAESLVERARRLVQLKAAMFRFIQAPDNRPEVALAALFQTGQLLVDLGRCEEAEPFFEQVLEWNPRWPQAREAYEAAMRQKRPQIDEREDESKNEELAGAIAASASLMARSVEHSTGSPGLPSFPPIRFTDRHREAGINFQYDNGADGQKYLLETTGGGVAVLDYDGDGWPDLFFPQGGPVPLNSDTADGRDALYRNQGDGTFIEALVTGLDDRQYSQGCAAGDFDNDGFPDLALANCGTNVLFHNNGDGTFTDVTRSSAIRGKHWSTSLGWGDLNRDGNLDLYVVNYVADHLRPCKNQSGDISLCHPQIFEAEPDELYLGSGDGTFEESARRVGMDSSQGRGLGLVIADFNDDGWPDVYVANDANPCFLFKSLGAGPDGERRFSDVGFPSGTAMNAAGNATAAMGIACADLDGDGRLDLYVTNFHQEADILYLNRGDLAFEDATRRGGLLEPTKPMLGWGTQALDVDLDGRPEIFLTNGHLDDRRSEGVPWKMPPQLFYNQGAGRFTDVSRASGAFFRGEYLGRGAARLDWNRDGRPDLVVVHQDRQVALLQNETERVGNFLVVELHGVESNRDAIGARLRVSAGGQTQFVALCGGDGYFATNERRQVIGLGAAEEVTALEVTWPSGRIDRWTSLPANVAVTVIEGRGRFDANALMSSISQPGRCENIKTNTSNDRWVTQSSHDSIKSDNDCNAGAADTCPPTTLAGEQPCRFAERKAPNDNHQGKAPHQRDHEHDQDRVFGQNHRQQEQE